MGRSWLVGLAAVLAAAPAAAAPALTGWSHLFSGDGFEAYAKPAEPTFDGYQQVWIRIEDDPAKVESFHSGVVRMLVDCDGKRIRRLEGTAFALPNLQGTATPADPEEDWQGAAPSALSGRLVERVCS
ncbi:MAG: hypothetical protein K1X35_10360 [Caulobacteraceae bacterium]|nr:hypothetical protein [Caulobacteraceae bacterium]